MATGEVLKSRTMLIAEPNDFVAEGFASLTNGGAALRRPVANDVLQRWCRDVSKPSVNKPYTGARSSPSFPLALIAPESRNAHCGAEFPGLGLLLSSYGEGTLEISFRFRSVLVGRLQRDFPSGTLNLGLPPSLFGSLDTRRERCRTDCQRAAESPHFRACNFPHLAGTAISRLSDQDLQFLATIEPWHLSGCGRAQDRRADGADNSNPRSE